MNVASWTEGYVADVPYITNFYREMTPGWISFAATTVAHRAPDISRPFRWAELGCGNGLNAAVVAAAHPNADVWAFDFNPAHVETARMLAAEAGLTNVRFVEASFSDLAEATGADLPEFDFVAAHGVYSWISAKARRELVAVVERKLRPGGLLYLSYNVAVGWAPMIPLRALMKLISDRSNGPSNRAMPEIIAFLDKLKEGGAQFFQRSPEAVRSLESMRDRPASYFAHEYLNAAWNPLMFGEVMDEVAEAKCAYVGSATLVDNLDFATVPAPLTTTFNELQDLRLRETARDFASGQAFRRDIFRRGVTEFAVGEHIERLDQIAIAGLANAFEDKPKVEISCAVGKIGGSDEVYHPILAGLASGPMTFADVQSSPGLAGKPRAEVLKVLTLLTAGGYAHPVSSDGRSAAAVAAAQRLNVAIARHNANGGEIPIIVAPLIGTAVRANMTQNFIIGAMISGTPAEPSALARAIVTKLQRTDRKLFRGDGSLVAPDDIEAEMTRNAEKFLATELPFWHSLGVLQ